MSLSIYDDLNIICCILGMIIFIYGIHIVSKILHLFPNAKMTTNWKVIRVLIAFFLIGYVTNIAAVIFGFEGLLLIMQAFVYAFGALFVMLVVRLSHKTYKIILESASAGNQTSDR